MHDDTPATKAAIPTQRSESLAQITVEAALDAVNLLVKAADVNGDRPWAGDCDNDSCPWQGRTWESGTTDVRAAAAAALVHAVMCHPDATPDTTAALVAEIDRWFPRPATTVHFDPGYGHPALDLTPEQASERFEALARDAWEAESARDEAVAKAEQLQALLDDRTAETAAADLTRRIATHERGLDRADIKAAVAAGVVGGMAAALGQPALALTGPAAVVAAIVAGLGALTVAVAASVIWPVLAWRVGGSDLDDEADAEPGTLAEAARARAANPEVFLGVLDGRNRGVASAARRKFRRVQIALGALGLTGLAAAIAAILA